MIEKPKNKSMEFQLRLVIEAKVSFIWETKLSGNLVHWERCKLQTFKHKKWKVKVMKSHDAA